MSNGLFPANISYSRTPRAHQSTENPVCRCERKNRTSTSSKERRPQTIVMSAENLGSNVVGSATECGGSVPRPQALFTHPVVGQFDVTIHIQQHIVQLEISVDYPCRERGGQCGVSQGQGVMMLPLS